MMLLRGLSVGLLIIASATMLWTGPSEAALTWYTGPIHEFGKAGAATPRGSAVWTSPQPEAVASPTAVNSLMRAMLRAGSCLCSNVRRVFHPGSPLSPDGSVPTVPIPAVPATGLLFAVGLVTAAAAAYRQTPLRVVSDGLTLGDSPARSQSVLILSQDEGLAADLARCVAQLGYRAEHLLQWAHAKDGSAARDRVLVVIDRRLSGYRALRTTEAFRHLPMMTVMVSESGGTEETLADDLEAGMDATHLWVDDRRLFMAKVRALVRRAAWAAESEPVVRAGAISLDERRHEVWVAGRLHHVPPLRFKLLKLFLEHPGRLFRRRELLDLIWGAGYVVEDHTLDVHLCWLRRLLASDPLRRQVLVTVRGVGVKLVVEAGPAVPKRGCRVWGRQASYRRVQGDRRRQIRGLKPAAPRAAS